MHISNINLTASKRTKNYFFAFCSIVFLFAAPLHAQDIKYTERIDSLHQNIYRFFYDGGSGLFYETNRAEKGGDRKHSFLWPLCALLQAANEEETCQPSKDYITPVMQAVAQYYSNRPPAAGYQASVTSERIDARFYDDNQWIAIACLDIYDRTGKENFLNTAKEIYHFMMTGFDTSAGGGLYWEEGNKKTKNTCSNGPGILVALQLYKITREQKYLDTALLLYNWVNAHLQSPDGLYYDNIKLPSMTIDSALYTYNTGTMLQANVLLYRIIKEEKYLKESERIAEAAEIYFYKSGKLPGNYWFNVVLLRGEIALYRLDKNRKHIDYFVNDSNRIWSEEKDNNGLVGREKTKRLIDQAAMVEIYARLEKLR